MTFDLHLHLVYPVCPCSMHYSNYVLGHTGKIYSEEEAYVANSNSLFGFVEDVNFHTIRADQ